MNKLKQQLTIPYFAYGSCMDMRRINKSEYGHCFRKVLGVGVLQDYSLKFTRRSDDGQGRADIVEDDHGVVEGKVYEIPVSVLTAYLYRREGVLVKAYRPTFVTVKKNGEEVQALTFVVVNKEPETAPPLDYEAEIFRGAAGYLSVAYLEELKRHIDGLRKRLVDRGDGSTGPGQCTG